MRKLLSFFLLFIGCFILSCNLKDTISGSSDEDKTCNDGKAEDGEFFCKSNVLYQCLSGEQDKIKNCNQCSYIGVGTGHEYDTSCRSNVETPSTWSSNFDPYTGPGCYFGDSQYCD